MSTRFAAIVSGQFESQKPTNGIEINVGVHGWRSGENTRLLPVWFGFDSQPRRHTWVEFVGSLLCSERFSPGTLVFPSPQQPAFDLTCVYLLISVYRVPMQLKLMCLKTRHFFLFLSIHNEECDLYIRSFAMIDGSEKTNRCLEFELQFPCLFYERRSKRKLKHIFKG